MKYLHLLVFLSISTLATHHSYIYHIEQRPCCGARGAPTTYRTKRKPAHSASFLLAALYGAGSGYLCRLFERDILNDIPPFRLVNIIIWGHMQEYLLSTVIEDMKEQHIGLSEDTMKHSAWLLSWLSYFLT